MTKTLPLLLFALLCCTAYAQPVEEEEEELLALFESEAGFQLGEILDGATTGLVQRADLNLDGVADLTLLRRDEQGTPLEVVTLDLTTEDPTPLWQYPYQDIVTALGTSSFRFLGFFSFTDGTADREVIFKSEEALVIISTEVGSKRATDPLVLPIVKAAVLDLTGDDYVEVIIQNSETGTVQVWGSAATNTATEEEIEAALHRLFQNYPNPFQETTTIAYEVEHPGPVTLTVYDVLGRRVRTLVEADQPSGTYQVQWDGRDTGGQAMAAGTYFYRLRIGQALSSKQAIRVR